MRPLLVLADPSASFRLAHSLLYPTPGRGAGSNSLVLTYAEKSRGGMGAAAEYQRTICLFFGCGRILGRYITCPSHQKCRFPQSRISISSSCCLFQCAISVRSADEAAPLHSHPMLESLELERSLWGAPEVAFVINMVLFLVSFAITLITRRQRDRHGSIFAFFSRPARFIEGLAKDKATRNASSLFVSQAKTFDCLSLAQLVVAIAPNSALFFTGYRMVALVFGIY